MSDSAKSKVGVGIIGLGTVGTATARILLTRAEILARRLGAPLELRRIADIDTTTDRGLELPPGLLTDDVDGLLADPEIDVVVETVGGLEPAGSFILRAIEAGKSVVTANKALLAENGREILAMAQKSGVDLAFEASVAGGIPLLRSFREGLAGDEIESFFGILNGTCNYILTNMSQGGAAYDDALAEAQKLGFAEADPYLDVSGHDTAHKLAILVGLAFGTRAPLEGIYVEGITQISPLDIEFAGEFGYTVKLLAVARDRGDTIEARVHPTMAPHGHPLAGVGGPMNAVYVSGRSVGQVMFYGPGAGGPATATAVVADIIELARNVIRNSRGRVPPLSIEYDKLSDRAIVPMDEVHSKYYFRFSALDRAGVLSKISGILADKRISIEAVIQKGRQQGGAVPIVMMTHEAVEKSVRQALTEIDGQDFITRPTVLIRVEDLL